MHFRLKKLAQIAFVHRRTVFFIRIFGFDYMNFYRVIATEEKTESKAGQAADPPVEASWYFEI